ncbi:MAG: aminotransferase class V-fold PLP-dependent enzyme [Phycisphaeraceae bacterium]|nr:aminotransferase class V-fold PLP-dependent enzyme [Phycisphaeraceae bacterium]
MTTIRRLYLDNAATSFPKPSAVHEAMLRYATEIGASPGRGAYYEAQEAGRLLWRCRERICRLVNASKPENLIFTLNTTDSLNLAIRGVLGHAIQSGRLAHMVTTRLDHNSVLRPFHALAQRWGINVTYVDCDPRTGRVDPDDIERSLTPDTCLVAVVHGSNVSGTVQPIEQIGRLTRQREIPFLVDAAQTVGHMPVDVEAQSIDLLAFPGHKGLLGPLGTGGLYIRPGIEKRMVTVREGGTGSISEQARQPDFMPDRFEPGSHNAVGIIGLSEGVQWILDRGIEQIWQHERELIKCMLDGLSDTGELSSVRYLGPQGVAHRCGVFSIVVDGYDQPQSLSEALEQQYGILTRSGIHCAPMAHETFGTHDSGGATRMSVGPFLSRQDIHYACHAVADLAMKRVTTNLEPPLLTSE